jgi:hypothetical protein
MEQDQNRDPQQQTDEGEQEDLEVTSDQAEGVAGGRIGSDPDAGAQRA